MLKSYLQFPILYKIFHERPEIGLKIGLGAKDNYNKKNFHYSFKNICNYLNDSDILVILVLNLRFYN